MNVEQIHAGFQWAEPLQPHGELEVSEVGSDLEISGLVPRYVSKEVRTDIIRAFEGAPKNYPIGQQKTGKQSPDVLFANADSDGKLISFVRKFGPVVARYVSYIPAVPDGELAEARV